MPLNNWTQTSTSGTSFSSANQQTVTFTVTSIAFFNATQGTAGMSGASVPGAATVSCTFTNNTSVTVTILASITGTFGSLSILNDTVAPGGSSSGNNSFSGGDTMSGASCHVQILSPTPADVGQTAEFVWDFGPTACWIASGFTESGKLWKISGPGRMPSEIQVPDNIDPKTVVAYEDGEFVPRDKYKLIVRPRGKLLSFSK